MPMPCWVACGCMLTHLSLPLPCMQASEEEQQGLAPERSVSKRRFTNEDVAPKAAAAPVRAGLGAGLVRCSLLRMAPCGPCPAFNLAWEPGSCMGTCLFHRLLTPLQLQLPYHAPFLVALLQHLRPSSHHMRCSEHSRCACASRRPGRAAQGARASRGCTAAAGASTATRSWCLSARCARSARRSSCRQTRSTLPGACMPLLLSSGPGATGPTQPETSWHFVPRPWEPEQTVMHAGAACYVSVTRHACPAPSVAGDFAGSFPSAAHARHLVSHTGYVA